jgi:hypothetical protein
MNANMKVSAVAPPQAVVFYWRPIHHYRFHTSRRAGRPDREEGGAGFRKRSDGSEKGLFRNPEEAFLLSWLRSA